MKPNRCSREAPHELLTFISHTMLPRVCMRREGDEAVAMSLTYLLGGMGGYKLQQGFGFRIGNQKPCFVFATFCQVFGGRVRRLWLETVEK